MVKVPWFGDSNAPKPSEGNKSDSDIAERTRKAEERAREAARLVKESGGKLRTDEAMRHVRDNE